MSLDPQAMYAHHRQKILDALSGYSGGPPDLFTLLHRQGMDQSLDTFLEGKISWPLADLLFALLQNPEGLGASRVRQGLLRQFELRKTLHQTYKPNVRPENKTPEPLGALGLGLVLAQAAHQGDVAALSTLMKIIDGYAENLDTLSLQAQHLLFDLLLQEQKIFADV